MRRLRSVGDLEFRDYVHPGDCLLWGQACGEPRTLLEHLFDQLVDERAPAGLSAFVGINLGDDIRVEHAARIQLNSYIGSGANSRLYEAGLLEIIPLHYSALPALVGDPDRGCDVALIRIPPPDSQNRVSLSTNCDYLIDAVRRARVVIAEIDERAPYTYGDTEITEADIDIAVPSQLPPLELFPTASSSTQESVAAHIAGLIDDGATLQLGVGSVAEAVLAQLGDRRHLGVHSGQISDGVTDLMAEGVVTGERKSLDQGFTVAGMLMGTRRLFEYADRNKRILLRRAGYTHAHAVLAQLPMFTAINSALEVDLTGQANSEVAGGRYIGAVGGAVDFLRGAAASPGGVPIVALLATAGSVSRIVANLSGPVSIPRSDVGVIVTEHGHADLRGLSLAKRAEAMIAIAAPEHRANLSNAADAALAAARRSQTR